MPTDVSRCPVCGQDHRGPEPIERAPRSSADDDFPHLCPSCAAGTTLSPCLQVCVPDPELRTCTACLRTMDEIMGWAELDTDERADVFAALRERRRALQRGDAG